MNGIKIGEGERVICVVIGNNREANIYAFKSFVRMQSSSSRWAIIGDDIEINILLRQFIVEKDDCEIYPAGTPIPQGNVFAIDATKL